MSNADKLLEEVGWVKIDNTEQVYDELYEYVYDGDTTMYLYFKDDKYGYSHEDYRRVVTSVREHIAITVKLRERGFWL